MGVNCPYCNKDAEPVTGEAIYPHRPDLFHKKFFMCRPCNAYVGTHAASGEPLGTLANATLRKLRNRAHASFDPFWLDDHSHHRRARRKKAYAILAKAMGIHVDDCHIGMFDEPKCLQVIDICQNKELFRSV